MNLGTVLLGLTSVELLRHSSAFSVMTQPSSATRFGAPRLCSRTAVSTSSVSIETSSEFDDLDEYSEELNDMPQDDGDVESLREEMQTAASAAPSEETADAVENALLRMVNKWQRNPEARNELTADDFYTVCEQCYCCCVKS